MTKRATGRTTGRSTGRRTTGSRTTGRSTPAHRTRRKSTPTRRLPRIDPTSVLRALGFLLLGLAFITLVGLIPEELPRFTDPWIARLKDAFGWGTYAMPAVLGIAGLWLLLRQYGHRLALPWGRLAGSLLCLVTLLGLTQHLSPKAAVAPAAGTLGGRFGYWLSRGLTGGLGWSGATVLFSLALAIGLGLLLALSLDDIVAAAARVRRWADGRRDARAARPANSDPAHARPAVTRPEPAISPRREQSTAPLPAAGAGASTSARPAGVVRPPAVASVTAPSDGVLPVATADEGLDPLGGSPEPHRWVLPAVEELLPLDDEPPMSLRDIRDKTRIIEETLLALGVPATVVEVNPGPVVTQFGVEPGYVERQDRKGKIKRMKVQVARIAALSNDLALALAAAPIRIEAPVPGKGIVGIEVPNREKSMVGLRGVMESDEFRRQAAKPLMVAFGRDVSGTAVVDDLSSLPHLLIAGATNSGKSVCINALIACLLCRNTPDDLRLLMVDPKRVELTSYNGIPHLVAPVVVEPLRVVGTLKWLSAEMDRRYQLFSDTGVRNLEAYNRKMASRGSPHLPNIVMFIDELADLMMVAPEDVERYICRLAQLSRATGIHLVIATQRPSVDVVTGLIKANFPARMSFQVSSQIDSRVIIDTPGADKLLGQGDGLYMAPDSPKLARIQGCYVSDGELERIVTHWKAQIMPPEGHVPESIDPQHTVQKPLWPEMPNGTGPSMEDNGDDDTLLPDAIDLIRRHQKASVSFLQRGLRIGYSRAARMIDSLEEQGIIGPATGTSKARDVLIPAPGDAQPVMETEEEDS